MVCEMGSRNSFLRCQALFAADIATCWSSSCVAKFYNLGQIETLSCPLFNPLIFYGAVSHYISIFGRIQAARSSQYIFVGGLQNTRTAGTRFGKSSGRGTLEAQPTSVLSYIPLYPKHDPSSRRMTLNEYLDKPLLLNMRPA